MFNKVCKQNIRCPAISRVIYLKAVSETSLGSRAPCRHGLVYCCSVFFTSAQPSRVPSSAFSTQMEELMQLDCSWASSGTTSNDITSICDVHRQQGSHLGNSKQTSKSACCRRSHASPRKRTAATGL